MTHTALSKKQLDQLRNRIDQYIIGRPVQNACGLAKPNKQTASEAGRLWLGQGVVYQGRALL